MCAASISSFKHRKFYYIYDLPYRERNTLCKILDADGKWEELGGRFMDVKQIELSTFSRAIYHKGSPTSELLDCFGRGNGTIDQLFVYLSHMNHQWAMTTISQYVSPKYHCLLNKSAMDMQSTEISPMKHIQGKVSPSAPFQSQMQSKSSSELIGAIGLDPGFMKPQVDPYNFKQNNDQTRLLPQKMSSTDENDNDLKPGRQQLNPSMNETASKVLNESDALCDSKVKGLVVAPQQVRSNEGSVAVPNTGPKYHDSRSNMKLNIPISQAPNGAIQKLNKFTDSRLPAATSNGSDDFPFVIKIPYKELLSATNNFQKESILGQGGFGIVYKALWKDNYVAVKRIWPKNKKDNSQFAGQISLKQSQTEMKVLCSCRIDNILALYGVSIDGPEPCLVYQFMVNGSLEDRLLLKGNSKPLSWEQRSKIAWGTAKGLNYLHSVPEKPLIHGDIKSANILLDKNMEPKIGDFGLAREGPSDDLTHVKVSSVHGTQVYLPPEYLRNHQLSEKVDVYSYGIVLLEIATGLRAYNDKLPKHKFLSDWVNENINDIDSLRDKRAGEEKLEWFEEILQIGRICSCVKKAARPNMEKVLEKFAESQQKIKTVEKIRKISLDMPESPMLSPMELQVLYDLKKGPNFMPFMPSGIKGPPAYIPHDPTLPSLIPSIHPSEIREPPSMPDFSLLGCGDPALALYSSLGATDGSSSHRLSPSISNEGISSTSLVPVLTELGTNVPHGNSVMSGIHSRDLPSTTSGVPSREQVVFTPKVEESELSLFSEEDENDNKFSEDEGVDEVSDESSEDDDKSCVDNNNESQSDITDIKRLR